MTVNKLKCYKGLLILFVLLTIALTIALIIQSIALVKATVFKHVELCTTRVCISLAALLLESMNVSSNPCDDFHGFICSNSIARRYPIEEGEVINDAMRQLGKDAEFAIKELLENDDYEGSAMIKARKMYGVCMDMEERDKIGITPVKQLVNKLGGWPLLIGEKWNSTKRDIYQLIGRASRFGLKIQTFSIFIAQDEGNPEINAVKITGPKIPDDFEEYLSKSKLRKRRSVNGLTEHIKVVASLFHSNVTFNEIEIEEMVYIDKKLNEFTKAMKKKNPMESYNKLTIRKLITATKNQIEWLLILNTMFAGTRIFSLEDTVIISDLNYVRKIADLFSKQKDRAMTNYMIYKVLSNLLEHMHSHALDIDDDDSTSRWRYCVQQTTQHFQHAVGRLYVEKYANKKAVMTTHEIIDFEVEAFKNIFQNSSWLDDKTRNAAIKKLNNIIYFIGYPEWIHNIDEVDHYYENVTITTSHFTNILDLKINNSVFDVETFEVPNSRHDWTEPYLDANAYYLPTDNAILVPIVILQHPYVDSANLMVVNFATIGTTLGHELGHGFDDGGRFYNEIGKLELWWSENNQKIYDNKTKCFIEQYDEFCPIEMQDNEDQEDSCLDGEFSLSENIADSFGLEVAYKAYKMWMENKTSEKQLPGLSQYTLDQLFFMSYAYTECENIDSEEYKRLFEESRHSPGKYRLIGTTDNFEVFSETFKCPKEQISRCKVW